MASFQTASLLNIIEQGQKMESVFVGVLLETAMKLSSITDANILVVVDTAHGRKWAGRRALKEEFVDGRLRLQPRDEEVVVDGFPEVNCAGIGGDFIDDSISLETPSYASAKLAKSDFNDGSAADADAATDESSSTVEDCLSNSYHNVGVTATTSTKLVGSQKRKRRLSLSVTQPQERRCDIGDLVGKKLTEKTNWTVEADSEQKVFASCAAESCNSKGEMFESIESSHNNNYEKAIDKQESCKDHATPTSTSLESDYVAGKSPDFFEDLGAGSKADDAFNIYDTDSDTYDGGNFYQEQIRSMLRSKMSADDIALHLKLPPTIVAYWIQVLGFPLKPENNERSLLSLKTKASDEEPSGRRSGKLDKRSLKSLIESNKSIREIADLLGVHPTTVYRAMKAYDLSLPGHGQSSAEKSVASCRQFLPADSKVDAAQPQPSTGQRVRLKRDRLQLLKQLIVSGATVRECANILGVHHTTIYRAMRNLNLDTEGSQKPAMGAGLPAAGPLLQHLSLANPNGRWPDPIASSYMTIGKATFPSVYPDVLHDVKMSNPELTISKGNGDNLNDDLDSKPVENVNNEDNSVLNKKANHQ